MSKKANRPEITDFWDDCLKFELNPKIKPKKTRQKSNSIDIYNMPNISNINNNNQRKKNDYLKNHKLLKNIVRTEESIDKNMKKSEERQIKRLTSMYNKELIDRKRKEKELIKLRENIINKELKNCPFKPEKKYKYKNKSYEKNYKKNFGEKKIYERGKYYIKKYKKNIYELKKEVVEEENEKFPFKPRIVQKDINKVLYGNNMWEKRANNFSNKVFLWRYIKARKDESDKKKRLIWSMDKKENENDDSYESDNKSGILNNNRIIHRSISQRDSLLYRKNLHFSLLDFRTINNDDDNNNNNEINIVK